MFELHRTHVLTITIDNNSCSRYGPWWQSLEISIRIQTYLDISSSKTFREIECIAIKLLSDVISWNDAGMNRRHRQLGVMKSVSRRSMTFTARLLPLAPDIVILEAQAACARWAPLWTRRNTAPVRHRWFRPVSAGTDGNRRPCRRRNGRRSWRSRSSRRCMIAGPSYGYTGGRRHDASAIWRSLLLVAQRCCITCTHTHTHTSITDLTRQIHRQLKTRQELEHTMRYDMRIFNMHSETDKIATFTWTTTQHQKSWKLTKRVSQNKKAAEHKKSEK